jgi:predicted AAA+ superfamily ATPase
MFIPRQLDLLETLAQKSCFLFGPRQTGKSMLIRETLPAGTPVYNLLDPQDDPNHPILTL